MGHRAGTQEMAQRETKARSGQGQPGSHRGCPALSRLGDLSAGGAWALLLRQPGRQQGAQETQGRHSCVSGGWPGKPTGPSTVQMMGAVHAPRVAGPSDPACTRCLTPAPTPDREDTGGDPGIHSLTFWPREAAWVTPGDTVTSEPTEPRERMHSCV